MAYKPNQVVGWRVNESGGIESISTPEFNGGSRDNSLGYAASHPSSVSTATDTGRVTTTSGISEQDYITNLVKGTAEAGQYNAATTYFDAMKSAMNTFSGGF